MTDSFQNLRQSCEDRKIPLISPETQAFLAQELCETKPKRVLEIWSAIGFSTCWISHIISKWWGRIWSFEVSYPAYLEALKNLQTSWASNATLFPFNFNEINLENFFSENFDFVFIDAQKSQYGNYLDKVQSVLTRENTVILDDVIKYQNKLSQLYSFLDKNQVNYEIFKMEEWDWVMKLFLQNN